MKRFVLVTVTLALASFGLFARNLPADDGPAAVDFAKHIQPIFAKHCVSCHGVDEQESGLRLDVAARVLRGGDRGPAVVPGKAQESLLYQALVGQGDVGEMPADGTKLSDQELALVKRWIDEGAKAPVADVGVGTDDRRTSDHWAFRPIERPAAPRVEPPNRVRHPLDAFVLARLERENVAPSPEADAATLVRRLSLDLRGIVPSIEEVEDFVSDERPDAYERVVDRMLASPQFGERWGRHWLDVARYADSNGFTIDGPRSIWKYRDWVIDAVNRDLPFDRFTIEQLAGDLLPDAATEQLIATGFHRNTLINQEGGTDQEQFRVEAVADRVDTTGTAWLGLTVGCAQCHAHKYDPISQREYYDLFAIFNNCDEPEIRVPAADETAALARLDAEIAAAEEPLAAHDAGFHKGMTAWEQALSEQARQAVGWTVLEPGDLASEKGSVLAAQDDRSIFVDFTIPPNDTFVVSAEVPLERVTAIRLEALTHASSPNKGPGRADNGNFVLSEFEVYGSRDGAASATANGAENGSPERISIARAVADHSQEGYAVADAIDGNPKTGWAINVRRGSLNVDREAIFFLAAPVENARGTQVTFKLRHEHKDPKYLIGRFRLSVSDASPELLEIPAAIRAILAKPADERNEADRDLLTDYYRTTDSERGPLAARVAELKKRREDLDKAVPTTMILRERKEPRETHIHVRGDFLRKGAPVTGGVPAVLPPLPEGIERPTRLDFSRWLVDERNPLTARVTVNRFWQHLFGTGLVDTENDFGSQGSPPTHPELLDWLAAEFRGGRESRVGEGRGSRVAGREQDQANVEHRTTDDGPRTTDAAHHSPLTTHSALAWSMKRLIRAVVTSATYRQSSQVREDLYARDPANRLLGRQSRLRLEAEPIRDAALAASGLFSTKMHGPGVYPPQPEGIYDLTQVKKPWPEENDADRYRRGMYIYFWRSRPYPLLPTFDAPEANTTCTRRPRSNTPLQALTLANDRAFHEIAQGLAARILREAPEYDEGRLRYGFALCLSREPEPAELARLLEFLEREKSRQPADESAAKGSGPADSAIDLEATESAWVAVARVLLNLDEFITRE
ncbi:MAG TPA: DUF1553 domain-containing protein [Planctomycetaceae bacterium]|nr:DUF1553 domain-containing protein [Planctomycetaceae bacterium]